MSSETSNLGLIKPDLTDKVTDTIPALATNMQKIDDEFGNLSINLLARVYWVTDPKYGADPTGTNDSTTAIQNAITDAYNAGQGIVYVPPGTYLFNTSLNLRQGVSLWGAGNTNTIIKKTTHNSFSRVLSPLMVEVIRLMMIVS